MDSVHIHHTAPFDCQPDILPYNALAVGNQGADHGHHSSHREVRDEAGSLGRNGQNPRRDPRWAEGSVRAMAPEYSPGEVLELLDGGVLFWRGDAKVGYRCWLKLNQRDERPLRRRRLRRRTSPRRRLQKSQRLGGRILLRYDKK